MKRVRILALVFFPTFILLSLAFAQQGENTEKAQLTPSVYEEKMIDLSNRISNISHGQLRYAGEEVEFISKKTDVLGNATATGFYEGQRSGLEAIKKDYASINPPPEYIDTHKLFGESLDYYIEAYGKAIEAHIKDDVSIMNSEGAVLLHKASLLLLQGSDELQKITKSRKGI